MSTTVSYKGNTIATLSNETKTLTTAGTWVEGDISITDASGTAAISVVDTTDSHGGTIREITALDISDTTAVASDVAQGKYFYTASGVKTAGTGSGGGSSSQTITGTIAGTGTHTLEIPCSFAPDIIHIYGDLSGDVTLCGITKLTIIKDTAIYQTQDGSSSNTNQSVILISDDIIGYNESDTTNTHASYSNGILTIDTVFNSAGYYFTSEITYSYKLISNSGSSSPSATSHTIYFEFSDSTDTSITAYYDNSFISNAITATTPTTYGSKTVELAQLDGVTWYEVGDIPLNTELVDYNNVKTGFIVDTSGEIVADESWECVTDYIPIDPSMTFTFKLSNYDNVGFYDSNKNMVRVISSDFLVEEVVGNYAIGTLNSTNIPSNAAYIVIPGNSYDLQNSLSLIRTA